MSIARFSVKNPVVANLLMIAIIAIGVVSLIKLPRELMSDISMGWVFIIKPYPGVSAEEIEKLITIPIEDEIQDVKGIESIASQSIEGSSFISVKFQMMSDDELRNRFEDIRAEVDKVQDLPEDALDTMVDAFSSADFMPVIAVHLHGYNDEQQLAELAKELKSELKTVVHISKIELTGVRDREVWVEADPLKLKGYHLSLEQIQMAIGAHGLNVPGGKLPMGRKEVLVRTIGEFQSAEEVKKVVLRSIPGQGTVRVGDVARVHETFEEEVTKSWLDSEPVVTLSISKQKEGNSIRIVDEVKAKTKEFVERYDNRVNYSFTQDSSEQIDDILSKLTRNAGFGFGIVLIVLFVVLGMRNAVLAALGIPISFFACFIAMNYMGESFNGNSLFGLVLVLGIIVDDAIIIVENCYRHRQMGKSWKEAAVDGTNEVVSPVMSATATTIAAFLPLMLLPGLMGKFMRMVPITVSLALVASMIEAFVILPSHVAEFPGKRRPARAEPNWLNQLRSRYEGMLRFVIRRRYWFCFGLAPSLVIGAILLIPVIGMDMFAGEEIATFQVRMNFPTGTSLESTSEMIERFEKECLKLPKDEIRAVHSTAGLIITDADWIFRTDVGQIWIDLYPSYQRSRSSDQIMDQLRKKLTKIPGPSHLELAKLNTGPPMGKPVEVKLKGKFFEPLEAAAEELKSFLGKIDGVRDIGDDFETGKEELRVRVDHELAQLNGLSVGQVGMSIRRAVDGVAADVLYEGDEEIEIVVRIDKSLLRRPEQLLLLPLLTPGGAVITLGDVASYELVPSISEIRRYKQERAITVFGDVDKSKTTAVEVNGQVEQEFRRFRDKFPGVNLDFSGEFEEFKQAFTGIVLLFLVGVMLIYGILGAQFRSYVQPLVVLGTVPLAFVGAALGLLISGNPFSIIAMFGWVALAGVAVNDAIVLVAFANNRRAEGMTILEAVVDAGKMRLRPIILTTVTTIAGLLPMATGLGGMSLTWSPLANTIVWGLAGGTFMTLFLVPALYVVLIGDVVEPVLEQFKGSTRPGDTQSGSV